MPKTASDPAQLIESPDNEVVKLLRRLGRRREPGAVLLEGPRVVREAVAAGVELQLLALREGERFDAPAGRRVTLAERVFKSVSQTVTPQGVLAIGNASERPFSEGLAASREAGWPLIVLDGVQDPGNVGTICRTAAAAGAPALAVMEGSADPLGPKAVRASAGNVFRLVVVRAARGDLEGLRAFGAAASKGTPLERAPIERAEALLLGSEAHGLTQPASLQLVTVPTEAGVESLNVAAAAAVLLFEIRRRKAA